MTTSTPLPPADPASETSSADPAAGTSPVEPVEMSSETSKVEPIETPAAPRPILAIIGLVLSIASIVLGQALLAVAGVVLGFVSRRQEPNGRTPAIWAIVLGFVALFGWLALLLLGAAIVTPVALFGFVAGL